VTENLEGMSLNSKNILITGGSRGFGFSLAKYLLQCGANIVICGKSRENLDFAKKNLNSIKKDKQRVEVFEVDVTVESGVEKLEKDISSTLGFIEILINNAGEIGPIGDFLENNISNWKKTFDLNLFGSVFMIQKFLPAMLENRKGRIIQLSGGGASTPLRGMSAYSASKSAIVRFIETIALESQNSGVYINSIAPGMLKTKLLTEMILAGPEKIGVKLFERALLKDKESIDSTFVACQLIHFLCSEESKGISGKLISAEWDNWQSWPSHLNDLSNSDVYTIRRITGVDRDFKWGDK
jgi:NAD(P)-dependent dehydrogenase (short-subunit alcohol dehydrogenase family)